MRADDRGMVLLVSALVLLLLVGLAVATAVRSDGYGTRTAPASHLAWDYDALPSTPPAALRR